MSTNGGWVGLGGWIDLQREVERCGCAIETLTSLIAQCQCMPWSFPRTMLWSYTIQNIWSICPTTSSIGKPTGLASFPSASLGLSEVTGCGPRTAWSTWPGTCLGGTMCWDRMTRKKGLPLRDSWGVWALTPWGPGANAWFLLCTRGLQPKHGLSKPLLVATGPSKCVQLRFSTCGNLWSRIRRLMTDLDRVHQPHQPQHVGIQLTQMAKDCRCYRLWARRQSNPHQPSKAGIMETSQSWAYITQKEWIPVRN